MRTATLAAAVLFSAVGVSAAGFLSERRATEKAAAILKGDPYGSTFLETVKHIKQALLITQGSGGCGSVTKPVWAFHVQARTNLSPIDGWLYIDARTGAMTCATLPFLD